MCPSSRDLVLVSPSVRPRPPHGSDRYPLGSPEWRNARGRELEVEGRVDEAVELYELNVRDGFVGPLPYDRLRVIYSQRMELASAIRVCQAAIKAMKARPEMTRHFEKAMVRLRRRAHGSMLGLGIKPEMPHWKLDSAEQVGEWS